MIGSDKKCQVDTMRKHHTTTGKTVQGKQCGKMDELSCPKMPQQYRDKSMPVFSDQQDRDQRLGNIDLVNRMELLAVEYEEVDRASMMGRIQSTLNDQPARACQSGCWIRGRESDQSRNEGMILTSE